ncbi:MAG: preprotein translocase subunit SecG [Candidatus Nealsonbacteria bacterium]
MEQYLPLLQIISAVGLIVLVLLQQRGTALGSAFGQEGSFYATRRGIQKKILVGTIIFGTVFILLAILDLLS